MSEEERRVRLLVNDLEPKARLSGLGLYELGQFSTAISLKRIADSLEKLTTTLEKQTHQNEVFLDEMRAREKNT